MGWHWSSTSQLPSPPHVKRLLPTRSFSHARSTIVPRGDAASSTPLSTVCGHRQLPSTASQVPSAEHTRVRLLTPSAHICVAVVSESVAAHVMPFSVSSAHTLRVHVLLSSVHSPKNEQPRLMRPL